MLYTDYRVPSSIGTAHAHLGCFSCMQNDGLPTIVVCVQQVRSDTPAYIQSMHFKDNTAIPLTPPPPKKKIRAQQ